MKFNKVLFISARFGNDSPMTIRWNNFYSNKKVAFFAKKVNWDIYSTSRIPKLILVFKIFLYARFNAIKFIHANDLESGLLSKYLCNWFGINFIYSANEIFSHEMPEDTEGSYTRNVKMQAEASIYEKAKIIFVPNKERIQFLVKLYSTININKYFLLENKALRLENNIEIDKDLTHIESPINFTVLYGGTFWYARKQESFPFLAKELTKINASLLLSGPENEYLQNILSEGNEINYVGNIHPGKFIDFIKTIDICLAWYFPTTVNDELCAPLKIFDYLLAGKPVVAPNLPYIRTLAKQFYNCIILFEVGDMQDCLQKIMAVKSNYEMHLAAFKNFDVELLLWNSQYASIDNELTEIGF